MVKKLLNQGKKILSLAIVGLILTIAGAPPLFAGIMSVLINSGVELMKFRLPKGSFAMTYVITPDGYIVDRSGARVGSGGSFTTASAYSGSGGAVNPLADSMCSCGDGGITGRGKLIPHQLIFRATNTTGGDLYAYIPSFDKLVEAATQRPVLTDLIFSMDGLTNYDDPVTQDSNGVSAATFIAQTNLGIHAFVNSVGSGMELVVEKMQVIQLDNTSGEADVLLTSKAYQNAGSLEQPNGGDIAIQFNLVTTGGRETTNFLETQIGLNYLHSSNKQFKMLVPAGKSLQLVWYIKGKAI